MKPTAEELLREFIKKYGNSGWRIGKDYSGAKLFRQQDNAEEMLSDLHALLDKLMPTKIEAQKKIFEICSQPDSLGKGIGGVISTPMKLEMFDEWFRSRMGGSK